MRRLARGSAALVFVFVTTATSALAEPKRSADAATRVSLEAPALLRADPAREGSASAPDGLSERMRARLTLAPRLLLARPTMLPSIAAAPRPPPSRPLAGFTPRGARDRVGIGRTVRLAHGRELVMDLTPSPAHCAPLVSLTF